MLTTIFFSALQATAPAVQAGHTFAIPGTEVQVRLELPGYAESAERLRLMRRSLGDKLITAADLCSADVRMRLIGGPSGALSSADWRRLALENRLLGLAQYDIGGFAAAEQIRSLTAPYRELDRNAFLVAGGAILQVHVNALESTEPESFGRERFAAIVTSTRFAVVRRTAWGDLPARYLELSHDACQRADGLAWLQAGATAEGADWIARLAYVEHAQAARSTDASVGSVASTVRAELQALAEPGRSERVALVLIEDALGLSAARAGDIESAQAHLGSALERAAADCPEARWGITVGLGLVRAAAKDAAGTAKLLQEAFAHAPALKERVFRDPLLDPVRTDAQVASAIKIERKLVREMNLGH